MQYGKWTEIKIMPAPATDDWFEVQVICGHHVLLDGKMSRRLLQALILEVIGSKLPENE